MIKKNWWKALGVLILLYVFIAGLLVPLKTGINGVNPTTAKTGDHLTLKVKGYNSFYKQSEVGAFKAWLKLNNDFALGAKDISVEDDRNLTISFDIPSYLPISERVQPLTLIVDNELDGASVMPNAVFVSQDSINPDMGKSVWKNVPISDLHKKSGMTFPYRSILYESIRNTYFHVPMWFGMILLFGGSVFYSIRYLRKSNIYDDDYAKSLTSVGILYGILGLVTGALWAKNTWGEYWSGDVKQTMSAITLFIYLAYIVLRSAFEDAEKQARIAAVYNIFAFVAMIPLLFVIPRMEDSLHPGAGGNPGFGGEDLDNTMRMVFYPAVIGWTLLGYWMGNVLYRIERLQSKILDF